MHMFGSVITSNAITRDEANDIVEKMFAPYCEESNNNGWWDWWQVGGRWTGVWGEYDPMLDPANVTVCNLCGGTGTRTDMTVANGCNSCSGKGTHVVWATQFAPYDGDVVPVSYILGSLDKPGFRFPYTFVTSEGASHRETYDPDGEDHFPKNPEFDNEFRTALEANPHGSVIVVDYHS